MDSEKTKEHFNRLYVEVSESVAAAKSEIAALRVDHEEGKRQIGGLVEKLQKIQERFDGELDLLAQHAEWDKFTIAFFGETNAGKSTLLDSLRILFKEERRQELLNENSRNLVKYEEALAEKIKHLRDGLKAAYEAHGLELKSIQAQVAVLKHAIEKEVADRNRIMELEAQARNRIAHEESLSRTKLQEAEQAERLAIVRSESSAKVVRRMIFTAVLAMLGGVGGALAWAYLMGR